MLEICENQKLYKIQPMFLKKQIFKNKKGKNHLKN